MSFTGAMSTFIRSVCEDWRMTRRLITAFYAVALAVVGCQVQAQDTSLSHLVAQAPVTINKVAPGLFLVDFGQAAFGNLWLSRPAGKVIIRFGEALKDGRVDRTPPGSVRYAEVAVSPGAAANVIVAPPADQRNSRGHAVLTPPAWGVVTPFRWVEVEGWQGELTANDIKRRAAFDRTWVDDAATFHSSDPLLDKVWDLSHYSIKATTFAGILVDGDRERVAYEADAYLDQLGYYAGDADPRMVRATFDRLMKSPTWPTEWASHMVFIAFADWMQTGDKAWLAAHYDGLKTKLQSDRLGLDGLVESNEAQMKKGDLVDWPGHERNGFVFTKVNTVVNAFHLRALEEMSQLAGVLGKTSEAAKFLNEENKAKAVFQEKLFDQARGVYRDGLGTDHASLHASLFPLAFGLVPPEQKERVAQWIAGRGMVVSVYAAQYLLEGLFQNGQAETALSLITAPGDRSWRHMVESGTTITWEAWDQRFKPNQDWNHAWGAAPANLLPRFVLGAQPLTPGWKRALIQPHPGALTKAEGRMPTPLGELSIEWHAEKNFSMKLTLPGAMTAKIELPAQAGSSGVWVNGTPVTAQHDGSWWSLEKDVSGSVLVEVR